MAAVERKTCEVLILGGGATGLATALRLRELDPERAVLVVDQAALGRSGELATGTDRLAPLPVDDEAKKKLDRRWGGDGLVDELDGLPEFVRGLGLRCGPRLDDYTLRLHGEAFKPRLAAAAAGSGAEPLEGCFVTDLLRRDDRVVGALCFHLRLEVFIVLEAPLTVLCLGPAAGLYGSGLCGAPHRRPANPFNAGAAWSLAHDAGATLIELDQRHLPVVLAETGAPVEPLLDLGLPLRGAGEGALADDEAELRRLLLELEAGAGPLLADSGGLDGEGRRELRRRYLERHPAAVLGWPPQENGGVPRLLELGLAPPRLDGGMSVAGIAVRADGSTGVPGLYAAGACVGGRAGKGLAGCLAEGRRLGAALAELRPPPPAERPQPDDEELTLALRRAVAPLERLTRIGDGVTPAEFDQRLRQLMDRYVGGAAAGFRLDETRLELAKAELAALGGEADLLLAANHLELADAQRSLQRLATARLLVDHLSALKPSALEKTS